MKYGNILTSHCTFHYSKLLGPIFILHIFFALQEGEGSEYKIQVSMLNKRLNYILWTSWTFKCRSEFLRAFLLSTTSGSHWVWQTRAPRHAFSEPKETCILEVHCRSYEARSTDNALNTDGFILKVCRTSTAGQ